MQEVESFKVRYEHNQIQLHFKFHTKQFYVSQNHLKTTRVCLRV